MPSPNEILAGLTALANDAVGLAILWHVLLAAALLSLSLDWKPTDRVAPGLLALPLASVALLAAISGNPFNAVMFGLATGAALALTAAPERAMRGPGWSMFVGYALLAFAWLYPHFVAGGPFVYLYASPLGVVPCPTLAMVIGLTMLGGGFGSRAWSYTLAGFGLFYGVFGVARLGVALDLPLIAGAVALAVAVSPRHAAIGPRMRMLDPRVGDR